MTLVWSKSVLVIMSSTLIYILSNYQRPRSRRMYCLACLLSLPLALHRQTSQGVSICTHFQMRYSFNACSHFRSTGSCNPPFLVSSGHHQSAFQPLIRRSFILFSYGSPCIHPRLDRIRYIILDLWPLSTPISLLCTLDSGVLHYSHSCHHFYFDAA